jgi:hypothetical protein
LSQPTIILIILIGLLAPPLGAQQPITGVVTESSSGHPVSGVHFSVDDGSSTDTSDTAGGYHLMAPAGRPIFTIRAMKIGFTPAARRINSAGSATLVENFQITRQGSAQ